MVNRRKMLLAGMASLLAPLTGAAEQLDAPAYQIVLRSRQAMATPLTTRQAQTGGGAIKVEQPEPNTIIVTMTGSAVAGSDWHESQATIDFQIDQELEIIPTRSGVRPPRIGMYGHVVGTLQVTHPGKGCKLCGTAEQGVAAASLLIGEECLLSVAGPSNAAACGQEMFINHRDGPVECPAVVGCYHLNGTFRIGAYQGKGVFHRQYSVADFDPAPQLDAFWADALKPFRAIPRRDFGFKIVLRVVEDPMPSALSSVD